MDANQKSELLEQTLAECKRFGDRPVQWQMPIGTALSVCGALQLALRHPDFKNCTAAHQVRSFVMAFQESIPDDFPAIKKTIGLGFHSRFDEPGSLSAPEVL